MKDLMSEGHSYIDSVQDQENLINAYYCISDGLLVLANLYRSAHLNFDGDHRVDTSFEEWMNDTFSAHFNILHRIRIVTGNTEKIFPFFGLDKSDVYCPIRAYVEKFFVNEDKSGIANDIAETVDFLAGVENEFLRMCLELYNSVISGADPAGENEVQGYIDASEKRLLDTSGIINAIMS